MSALYFLTTHKGALMTITEKIMEHVKALSEEKQTEVLDFVEFLETRNENRSWNNFSLSSAMRGLEEEPALYSVDDINE